VQAERRELRAQLSPDDLTLIASKCKERPHSARASSEHRKRRDGMLVSYATVMANLGTPIRSS
jgi:hypothetical protein